MHQVLFSCIRKKCVTILKNIPNTLPLYILPSTSAQFITFISSYSIYFTFTIYFEKNEFSIYL